MAERVAYAEEGSAGRVTLAVSGDLDHSLLDGLQSFVQRRRCRIVAVEAGDLEIASWGSPEGGSDGT